VKANVDGKTYQSRPKGETSKNTAKHGANEVGGLFK